MLFVVDIVSDASFRQRLLILRCKLQHFVNSLHNYVMTTVG